MPFLRLLRNQKRKNTTSSDVFYCWNYPTSQRKNSRKIYLKAFYLESASFLLFILREYSLYCCNTYLKVTNFLFFYSFRQSHRLVWCHVYVVVTSGNLLDKSQSLYAYYCFIYWKMSNSVDFILSKYQTNTLIRIIRGHGLAIKTVSLVLTGLITNVW